MSSLSRGRERRARRSAGGRIGWWFVAMLGTAAAPSSAQQTAGRPQTPPTPAPEVSEPAAPGGFVPPAPNAVADAPDPDLPSYRVGAFIVRYVTPHPQLPALDDVGRATVTLGRVESGFVRPGGGVPTATYTLDELSDQPAQPYTVSALDEVGRAIQRQISSLGLVAIRVTLSDREFAPKSDPVPGEPPLEDLRGGRTSLTILVQVVTVKEVRTVAFGETVPFEERIDNPRYQRILDGSPVRPFSPDDDERVDLLRKDKLDDYVYRLNRHPGRRVDLGIAAADEDNALILDYYVNESKPWLVYFQISNTGTDQTELWRERFGFTHNQLTNSDDILSLDYITAGFSDTSNAFNISYERPVWGDWLRGRIYGGFSDFTASDVGVQTQNFKGDSWTIGAELIANVFQHKDWFIDAYAGAHWDNVHVESEAFGIPQNSAREEFFLPQVGLRFEHLTDKESTTADLGFEFSTPSVADTDEREVANGFQRTDADADWATFQWNINHSFYLEPLLIPTRWKNLDWKNDPTASPTLAHELALSLRGQYAFGYRLIPNYQQVAGGLYSVRGYPESVAAGDSIVIGSLEYRFHLPQALGFDETPGQLFGKPFRARPQGPYGRADWDLILKAFLDVARTGISSAESGEEDQTLLGTGIGAEFLFRRNLSVRVDWGIALEEVEDSQDGVSAGSNRFHISATILF